MQQIYIFTSIIIIILIFIGIYTIVSKTPFDISTPITIQNTSLAIHTTPLPSTDKNVTELLKNNKKVKILPDLYQNDINNTQIITQPIITQPIITQPIITINTSNISTISNNTPESTYHNIGIKNKVGYNIEDIGKTLTDNLGEINTQFGYSSYNTDYDYTLLPTNLYDNTLNYQKLNLSEYKSNTSNTSNTSNLFDKFPRTIIQKDFEGVSNIFAPNFIFLGTKDDYNIGFDEYLQYM